MSTLSTTMKQDIMPGFTSREAFQQLWNMASIFSKTNLVPKQFQGEKHVGDCAIAINMANRMGADPLMVMQNLYVVYGNPSWSSKFMIATFNQCGKYSSIKYKMVGTKGNDDYGCIAYAKELATGEILEGPTVTIGLSKQEGWFGRDGSKWQTMPEQMLRYRAAAWFIRSTAPELFMGLQSVDEVLDEHEKDITPITVEKPTEEVQKTIASKKLELPKDENVPKKEAIPTKKAETVPKNTTIVPNDEEQEMPDKPPF